MCEQCESGKYGVDEEATDERSCIGTVLQGKYSPSSGSSSCMICPSGTACALEMEQKYMRVVSPVIGTSSLVEPSA